MAHLLIVDDEESICWGLTRLARSLGHSADTAASAEQGLERAAQRRPDALVLDVRLPGLDGLAAMPRFRSLLGPLPIIVITAYGDLETAVKAVRNGAFDYLVKPFELAAAQRAIQRALRPAATRPAERPATGSDDEQIVGTTPAMQEIFKRMAVVAPAEACVHLTGESGTGKELVARAIHRYSHRAAGPFVAVNMAAVSPSLAESELFGHVRGAFTGAEQARKGLLEQAHGGTLFLDEVADTPPTLQVKVLRVLEHGEIRPVGADRPIPSDFRVISATHQDLRQRVKAGQFRHDLYFRLVTFEINIPPLRERGDDIAALANHFLDRLTTRSASPRPALAPEALRELQSRSWVGNVRELRNAVEHAMILARGGTILPEHFPPPIRPDAPAAGGPETEITTLIRRWAELQLAQSPEADDLYSRLLKLVEPPLLQAALEQHGGQCATAARQLGLHRTTLRRKLDEIQRGEP
jgi:two-component system nitrogen regulation response regulator GlnG